MSDVMVYVHNRRSLLLTDIPGSLQVKSEAARQVEKEVTSVHKLHDEDQALLGKQNKDGSEFWLRRV